MQNWNIEKFLQQALPQELGSLRLVDVHPVTGTGVQVWRSHMVPFISFVEGPDAPTEHEMDWEFILDMLWELESKPASLQFWTVAGISVPGSMRRWLEYTVRQRNYDAPVHLHVVEQRGGNLCLQAKVHTEITKEGVEEFTAPYPSLLIVEQFSESFKDAADLLLKAWKDGLGIGAKYREMH